ncbi:MAG TPA: TIGR02452 family protein [Polyangium sp.]|nr:TIGR02452 family protein [Polyangium sp.]
MLSEENNPINPRRIVMSIQFHAQQILDVVASGGYTTENSVRVDIRALQEAAARNTELFHPDKLEALFSESSGAGESPRVEVIEATTTDAALKLSAEKDGVVLLNFASARNPGGGFLGGARAQEEEVCRCSGLYPLLVTQPKYYETNRAQASALYTDYIIYSRDVPFFRTSAKDPWLEKPFVASVITAPAPNAGAIMQNQSKDKAKIRETFERRWRNVLLVAAARGHRSVLLGAWGCGAFRNDPEVAASTARMWLTAPRFAGCFDKVVFAIPGGGRSGTNLDVFRRVLDC